MNLSHIRWQTKLAARQLAVEAADAEAAAAQAAADAAAAQSTANTAVSDAATAQSTASTGVTNASAAQGTADEALETAGLVGNALGQEQIAGGKSPMPLVRPIGGGTAAEIVFAAGLTADSIQYQINGGGYGLYSGLFALSPGDLVEAYSVTSGLSNSDVYTYEN